MPSRAAVISEVLLIYRCHFCDSSRGEIGMYPVEQQLSRRYLLFTDVIFGTVLSDSRAGNKSLEWSPDSV